MFPGPATMARLSPHISTAKSNLVSSGNETFDKFLGGGLLDNTLNIFDRSGPSSTILEPIISNSFAVTSLKSSGCVILVNLNAAEQINNHNILSTLPSPGQVRSDVLYRDVRDKSTVAKIKIAWRYSQRDTSSPTDRCPRIKQIDFRFAINTPPRELGPLVVINASDDETVESITSRLSEKIEIHKKTSSILIIIKDFLHPFCPIGGQVSLKFIYALRCISRTLKGGCILVQYDRSLCENYFNVEQSLYNLADCVVSFYSYETGENKLTGYNDIDGTLSYIKVPKINSFGFHFQQQIADWGYRLTKNLKYFVVDELSLPPCDDDNDEGKGKQCATSLTRISNLAQPLAQVDPLEEFRDVAKDVIAKKL